MMLLLLTLIFLPFLAYELAKRSRPQNIWAISGITFGIIIYPFLFSTTVPLIYGGAFGHVILNVTNPITILHRLPGKVLYHVINGYPIRGGLEPLLVGLNAAVWASVYGSIGWYLDRNTKGE